MDAGAGLVTAIPAIGIAAIVAIGPAMFGLGPQLPDVLLSASEPAPIDIRGVDFLVDVETLRGKTVRVVDGQVAAMNNLFGLLKVQGGHIALYGPWANREGVRFALENCTDILPGTRCRLAVTGVAGVTNGQPSLSRVQIHLPAR